MLFGDPHACPSGAPSSNPTPTDSHFHILHARCVLSPEDLGCHLVNAPVRALCHPQAYPLKCLHEITSASHTSWTQGHHISPASQSSLRDIFLTNTGPLVLCDFT